jgi:hydrogenase maturation protease
MATRILGCGNELVGDDGLGIKALEYFCDLPGVECVNAGVGGIDIMPLLLDIDKVIIIDAVQFGKEPGTIFRLTPEDLPDNPNVIVSMHDLGLLDVLLLAEKLYPDRLCEDIVIFGVEIRSVMQFDDSLTKPVQEALKDVRGRIYEELGLEQKGKNGV